MAVVKKRKLSGSTDGKAIKIGATGTTGTTIHTAVAGQVAGSYDEVWLWAYNGHTEAVVLTIEFGGVSVPDQNIVVTVANKSGLMLVVPGFLLQNGLLISAFAGVANVITINGYVNNMTD